MASPKPALASLSRRVFDVAGVFGYPRKTGQLEDSHRDLKCRKARPRWLRIQKPEALMLQSVPPYVDTRVFHLIPKPQQGLATQGCLPRSERQLRADAVR